MAPKTFLFIEFTEGLLFFAQATLRQQSTLFLKNPSVEPETL